MFSEVQDDELRALEGSSDPDDVEVPTPRNITRQRIEG